MRGVINYRALIISFSFYFGHSDIVPDCKSDERATTYLDIAVDMIAKAKASYPVCPKTNRNSSVPVDCEEIFHIGYNISGVYTIWPRNRIFEDKSMDVYCDMVTDNGGWTVLQRRGNFSRSKDYFFKDWESYKKGFGDIEKDFWLGNDNIFGLTSQRMYSIRFDLKDVEGNATYALYDTFYIDDEDRKYTLHIKDYSGNAGDSMIAHDNHKFSTKDQDNDVKENYSCAQTFKGGWWYNSCHHSNLNGQYLFGKHDSHADGVNWYTWKGHKESLAFTEMKIRSRGFKIQIVNFETPKY